jgi:hypothetical protein
MITLIQCLSRDRNLIGEPYYTLQPRHSEGYIVSARHGSPIITGYGTNWGSNDQAGQTFQIPSLNSQYYNMLSVDSATQIILDRNWDDEEAEVTTNTCGNSVVTQSGGIVSETVIDANNTIIDNGTIVSFQIFTLTVGTNKAVKLKIGRLVGGIMTIVAESDLITVATGINTCVLTTPIAVLKGDYIGCYSQSDAPVCTNSSTGVLCYASSTPDAVVGDTLLVHNFLATLSLKVTIQNAPLITGGRTTNAACVSDLNIAQQDVYNKIKMFRTDYFNTNAILTPNTTNLYTVPDDCQDIILLADDKGNPVDPMDITETHKHRGWYWYGNQIYIRNNEAVISYRIDYIQKITPFTTNNSVSILDDMHFELLCLTAACLRVSNENLSNRRTELLNFLSSNLKRQKQAPNRIVIKR